MRSRNLLLFLLIASLTLGATLAVPVFSHSEGTVLQADGPMPIPPIPDAPRAV